MKGWEQLRQKWAELTVDCNGMDRIARVCLWTLPMLILLGKLTGWHGFWYAAIVCAAYMLFRIFSTNTFVRKRECVTFTRRCKVFKNRCIRPWFKLYRHIHYVDCRCPRCNMPMGVPRHQGVQVYRCKFCSAQFEHKV